MKSNKILFVGLALGVVLLFGGLLYYLVPKLDLKTGDDPSQTLGYSSDAIKGEIIQVLEEGDIQLGEVTQEYQVLLVKILEGEYQGIQLKVDYGKRQLRPEGLNLKPGDQVILSIGRDTENQLLARFQDFVRTGPLLILFFVFVLLSVLISGWKGVRGLIGMGVSIAVILFYIIPQILDGKDPVWVSISGAFFLLAVTLYLVYGWTIKTHSAVLGTLISLVMTALLADYFVDLTRLTGFGSEDTLFLVQQTGGGINVKGLVLGGMLIGALGVLDDLVITQASVVFELFGLDPTLSHKELYKRAMRVGQDHVAATVNTLVLAYVGASLPMFLLFTLSDVQLGYLINLEYVAEEIVRTMVGSLGLISAVPLTTTLSAFVARNSHRLGDLRKFLGPLTSDHDHHHHHSD